MTIKRRLILNAIASIALVCAMGGLLHGSSQQISAEMAHQAAANKLVHHMTDLIIVTEEYLAYGYVRCEQQWTAKYEQITTLLAQEPELRGVVHSKLDELNRLFAEIQEVQAEQTDLRQADAASEDLDRIEILAGRLSARLRLISREITVQAFDGFNTAQASLATITRRNMVVTLLFVVVMIGITSVNAYAMIAGILPPLRELVEAATRVRQGDMTEPLENPQMGSRIRPDDEIGELAEAFKDMTRQLLGSLARLETEAETRQRLAEALQASEKRLQSYIARAPNGIFVADNKGDYVEVNAAAEVISGYTQEELLTMNLRDLISPAYAEQAREHFLTVLRDGEAGGEIGFVRKDGNLRYWTIDAVKLSEDRTLGFVSDITDRIIAEEELRRHRDELETLVAVRTDELQTRVSESERLNRAMVNLLEDLQIANRELTSASSRLAEVNQELEDFAYVVSHDLKAPLRGISQLATWIVDDYGDVVDDAGRHMLQLMAERVQRMHALIDGVLAYSRVGRSREEVSPVNLGDLVNQVTAMLDPPEHIHIVVQDDLPTIHGEPTKVMQVFQNLLDNAIKYMDKRVGEITVSCQAQEADWQFRIKDNGPGIAPQHQERVFRLFQSLSSQSDGGGTGVGLALVKRIIETHGGRVWIESIVDEGSTFIFTWPKGEQI